MPSLFRVEEELSRGRGRGPRGGQAAAKNTPRSEDSNPPGESSDSEDGDSAGVPETRGWPIPEATRERADKDKQLRVAVEKILLYWGKEENKERGMSDELMDFMVELLDKYNAYVHCEYEAPWGAAIERFIEAINDLDGIDQHLDEFVEEVGPF